MWPEGLETTGPMSLLFPLPTHLGLRAASPKEGAPAQSRSCHLPSPEPRLLSLLLCPLSPLAFSSCNGPILPAMDLSHEDPSRFVSGDSC